MDESSGASARDSGKRPMTLRVTVRYRGTALELGPVVRVAMRAPTGQGDPPREGQAGFWIEIHGPDGALLFHRVLSDPIRVDFESFGERGQTITRHPIAQPAGEFELLVPEFDDAQSLVLQGSPPVAGRAPLAARPLLQASFDELRRIADKYERRGGTS